MPGIDKSRAMQKVREELDRIDKKNRLAFEGEYAEQLNALLGLSSDDLAAVSPIRSNAADYANLIDVVREASARNLSAAELKGRIEALGRTSVQIASLVPTLGALLR